MSNKKCLIDTPKMINMAEELKVPLSIIKSKVTKILD
jgi:hypothetical protein